MPLPSLNRMPGGMSPAGSDLGLGTMLADQVSGETEEQRKKRMMQQQQQGLMPPGTAGNSAASLALFGGVGAIGN